MAATYTRTVNFTNSNPNGGEDYTWQNLDSNATWVTRSAGSAPNEWNFTIQDNTAQNATTRSTTWKVTHWTYTNDEDLNTWDAFTITQYADGTVQTTAAPSPTAATTLATNATAATTIATQATAATTLATNATAATTLATNATAATTLATQATAATTLATLGTAATTLATLGTAATTQPTAATTSSGSGGGSGSYNHGLTYANDTREAACNSNTPFTLYSNDSILTANSVFWSDANLSGMEAPLGWYSDGVYAWLITSTSGGSVTASQLCDASSGSGNG